jgi:hypothetical protein
MAQTTTYSAIDSAINAGNVETRRGYSSGITNPKIIEGATDFKPIAKRSYTITFTSERLNGIKGNVIVLDYWLEDSKKWWKAFEASEHLAHYLVYDKLDRPCIKTTLDSLIITSCVIMQ